MMDSSDDDLSDAYDSENELAGKLSHNKHDKDSNYEVHFTESAANTTHSDELEEELEKEKKVIGNVNNVESLERNDNVAKMLTRIQKVTDDILIPKLQDITNMFSDGGIFLVDGDSLLLHIMEDKNYDSNNGGQFLHLVYLCERYLQLFVRKGGIFEFVFFNIWKEAHLGNHSLLLARAALIQHLKCNMNCNVHELDSIWSAGFVELLQKHKCEFLLADFGITYKLQKLFPSKYHPIMELMFCVQMCYSLIGLSLACVDMNDVEFKVSTLDAFYCSPIAKLESKKLERMLHIIINEIKQYCNKQRKLVQIHKVPVCYDADNIDARYYVTVLAAAHYLRDKNISEVHEPWIYAFLMYSALLDVMPLKFRGCSKINTTNTEELITFIETLHAKMYCVLEELKCNNNNNIDFKNVSDLWHGNFFVSVSQFINTGKFDDSLGEQTERRFEELRIKVSQLSGTMLKKSSVVGCLNLFQEEPILVNDFDNHLLPISLSAQLIPTSCIVTHEFCKNVMKEAMGNQSDEVLCDFVTKNKAFKENKHWHSKKPLTDEYDRIKEDKKHNVLDKKTQRQNSKYAYHMEVYGSSLGGKPLSEKAIVCKNDASSKKKKSEIKKVSKSAQVLIDKINEGRQKENREFDNMKLKELKSSYKKHSVQGTYEKSLKEVTDMESKLKTENILEFLLLKAKILWHLWKKECFNNSVHERNLNYAKELFLLIRRILTTQKDFSDKEGKQLGEYLYKMGLDDVAQFWNLPKPNNILLSTSIGKNWIEFQLLELSSDLKPEPNHTKDKRVDFVPDDWQRNLFDYIDNRQSVLVVAPTSSGKTYASYYCMEEVLREGNDGVVVYVSPTKALVNQVAATVYAKFKNKIMPPGKSVYGVLTRDYRVNALNCQILITVPQCLEMLLLSPRRYDWASRLRYVIFDEIHCLAGQAGGFTWESGLMLIQCPFIALSATIENPETLLKWLQGIQDFKKNEQYRRKLGVSKMTEVNAVNKPSDDLYKVNLVIHRDRHSDLKKYVYCKDTKFHHVHPYAYLDMGSIEEGIPSGISLSPDEVYQLYLAMKAAFPNCPQLANFLPEQFFSETKGFLTRNSVQKFESGLKTLLQQWTSQNSDLLKSVTEQLNAVESPLSDVSEMIFIQRNIKQFLVQIQKENMLPALLFSYNRGLVESLFEYTTRYFEDVKVEIDNANRRKCSLKPGKEEKEPAGARGNRIKKPLDLLCTDDSQYNGVKQVGYANEKVINHIERQLKQIDCKKSNVFARGLSLGVGIHHGGRLTKERNAVEMLFRMKVVNIVFATGTLALGIHMPCKTVAIIGDSPFLNPLEYQQMSGRAGRRGYDVTGNVVFMGLNERKMKRLIIGKLPKMIGNIPLSITMVLRVLLLVSTVTSRGKQSEEVTVNTLSRALAMLECCLIYETIPELKNQMKYFFLFASQFLMIQGLLDDKGQPQFLTGIITHLHYHEPGNFAFVFLMKSGALRELCKSEGGDISHEIQMKLILVLSYLFAPLPLHENFTYYENCNSKVILPPLPSEIKEVLEEYNQQVIYIFDSYFKSVAKSCTENMGEDNSLPLSGVQFQPNKTFSPKLEGEMTLERQLMENCEPRVMCSSFAALSGHTDNQLYSHESVSNIRHQIFTDMKMVPIVELDATYNGYAWDFYNHGIAAAIRKDNMLKQGDDFRLLLDFHLVLKCIVESLTELEPMDQDDKVLKAFNTIAQNFGEKFTNAYYK